jgi:hypothetical protein
MAFSVLVEVLNMRLRKTKDEPVHLRDAYTGSGDTTAADVKI